LDGEEDELDDEARFVAEDSKVIKRPVASMVAEVVAPLACVPSVATETRCVNGVQPDGAPAQVSRIKASVTPFVSLSTKFIAEERKAT
jgi:hypothetical protein